MTVLSFLILVSFCAVVSCIEYVAYSSQSQFDCFNATINDKCILYCDEVVSKPPMDPSFDCGSAGVCELHCTMDNCLESGSLNASNAGRLVVTSSASECLRDATVHLPDAGNASFTMSAERSFRGMTVYSGASSQYIVINCTFGTGNECNGLVVDAAFAQYLEIIVGADSELDGNAVIDCPQNSTYQGPENPPCIIDASQGGSITAVALTTLNGIPFDVWIDVGAGTLSRVTITCVAGSGGFDEQNICWHSLTNSPTTMIPTMSPEPTTAAPITARPTTSSITTTTLWTTTSNTKNDTTTTTGLREGEIVDATAAETTTAHRIFKPANSNETNNAKLIIAMVCIVGVLFVCILAILLLRRYKQKSEDTQYSEQTKAESERARREMLEIEGQREAEQITKGKRISNISLLEIESVHQEDDFKQSTLKKFSYALGLDALPTGSPKVLSVPTDEGYHDEELDAFKDELDEIDNEEQSDEEQPDIIYMGRTPMGGVQHLNVESHAEDEDEGSMSKDSRDRPLISSLQDNSNYKTPKPPARKKKHTQSDRMEYSKESADIDGVHNDDDIVDVIDNIEGRTSGN